MNAITENRFTAAWRRVGERTVKPRAILSISAHWFVPGTAATIAEAPRTIHDFGGFPPELYAVQYPAPGDPDLARRIRQLLAPTAVALDDTWGLDHGTWSVLKHVFPLADVPVVQLAIDELQAPRFHFEIGRKLAALRNEGVLIVGSGNLVHNLEAYAWGRRVTGPYDWAVRFETEVKRLLLEGDEDLLVDYSALGPHAALAVPTPEHYLPFLYVLGARLPEDEITFPVDGIEGGSISMLTVEFGPRAGDRAQHA
jgi:4,5-DOPA dioxygenase extradiol